MTNAAPPQSPPSSIEDLFTLTLFDGLPVVRGDKPIRYKVVKLRETGVGDERAANRLAERVVMVGNAPQLLCSPSDFKFALNLKHIVSFHCDHLVIDGALLDLELLGKLSSHDMGLIEGRIFLINVASQVRYGLISPEQFQAIVSGTDAKTNALKATSPQPVGPAEEVGPDGGRAEPGPALLTDFVAERADGAAPGVDE